MITFKNGKIHDVVIRDLMKYQDQRGWLMELFRSDEIAEEFLPTMSYISQTEPEWLVDPTNIKIKQTCSVLSAFNVSVVFMGYAKTISNIWT